MDFGFNPSECFTVSQCAATYKRSEQWIRLLIKDLRIRPIGQIGGVNFYRLSDEVQIEERINHPKPKGPAKLFKTFQVVGLVWQMAAMKGRRLDKPELHRTLDATAKEAGIAYTRLSNDEKMYPMYNAAAVDAILALYGLERTIK